MPHHSSRENGCQGASLFVGVVIMLVGIALLVDQATFLQVDHRFWPFIVLAIGSLKFVADSRSGGRRSRRSGVWLLFVGAWGLVNEFHVLGLEYSTSWPLMIVGSGLMIMWRAYEGDDGDARRRARQES
jgi:hypothetical protein